jgi:hypothetical protein
MEKVKLVPSGKSMTQSFISIPSVTFGVSELYLILNEFTRDVFPASPKPTLNYKYKFIS